MPRRSTAAAAFDETMPMANGHHRTERSHEENQERAYIAASRRSDRGIEARIQSAHMASEIHKKRTGRGFKITKEVVMKEEMYEEENGHLPRSHRLLGVNLQTPSTDINSCMEGDLSNKTEVWKMLAKANEEWRENEINSLFARSFPNALPAAQQAIQMSPNAAASQHAVKIYSSTAYAPMSCPRVSGITAHATTPSFISASTTHCCENTRNRRRSCTTLTPMSSSRENSLQTASRLPNSSSSETTNTTTTPSIDSTTSSKTPAESTSHMPTLEIQATLDPRVLSNRTTRHELSEMPHIIQMSQVGPRSVPDYGITTDETNICKDPMPCILDDNPWKAFINDAIWAADSQQ